ncbi:TPA: glycosyltransferase, partial [Enterococcus faecium]
VDFSRSLSNLGAIIKSYKQLKRISKKKYDIVHCHSPIGGVLTRIIFRKLKTKVLYTAHGFHFYKDGPKINWLIFYPIEKFLSRYTDILLTINNDDTNIAKKFHSREVIQIPGVGIDYKKIREISTSARNDRLIQKLNIKNDVPIFISVGELNDNKNHITAIKGLSKMEFDFYYLIIGKGRNTEDLKKKVIQYELTDNVIFLGYQNNVFQYYALADASIFISKREGLGLAGLEAMAAGLPLISTYVGGIKDYTEDGETGFVFKDSKNVNQFVEALEKWINLSNSEKKAMSDNCRAVALNYDIEKVNNIMKKTYSI